MAIDAKFNFLEWYAIGVEDRGFNLKSDYTSK
jgi:hypothetical protein